MTEGRVADVRAARRGRDAATPRFAVSCADRNEAGFAAFKVAGNAGRVEASDA
jgi:hypothetical protein